ncbi:ATP-binding protein [Streptomyces sp. GD-15H]|uniref:ATP-binding protein n=1 Tax=Streptomyces sp. GD-15H TaxID=3129112 RepID=UPI00324AF392
MEPVPGAEDGAALDRSALQTTVALDGDGTSIARARHRAAGFLTRVQAERGLRVSQRALDLTQLVVSELVTNARKYAPGPALMHLRIAGDMVEVVVWDSEPVLPAARPTDAGRVGQHGLEIVRAVVQSLAVQRESVGKRITARIALLDDPASSIAGRSPV